MKPKTKLQKKVVALSAKVKPISKKQEEWAEENCFDKYFVRVRNRNNCLECGHKWKPKMSLFAERVVKPTCPNCGTEGLNHVDNWNTDHRIYEYYAKIEVIGGFQLVRMFRVEKYMKRKQPVQYCHIEAMQHFITEDGKSESLQRLALGLGAIYIDSWVYGSHLELRGKSEKYYHRNSIAPYKIIPGRKTLPIIRRNGYTGYFYGKAPNVFFETILNNQKAETLLKARQKSLFRYLCGLSRIDSRYDCVQRHWDSICIAMRHNYIVEGAGDWLDYLGMLEEFGKDLHNPHYICPDNLHQEHQRYVDKRRIKRRKEERQAQIKRIQEAEIEYRKLKSKYFDFEVTAGDLRIVVMKSVRDVIELGDKLHHCLDMKYANKKESLILGAFIDDEPIEAIELNISSKKIVQARGLQNLPTEHHDQIVEVVESNISKLANRNKMKEVA